MRRVLVIGSGGAGKSTVATEMGERLGLPVVHLDRLYWQPGWVETPKAEWKSVVQQLLQRETWVMDGNYGGTLDARLAAADTVVFLDLPRWLCLWRVVKRRLQYRGRTRPDMTDGCPERLTGEFIHWVWTYRAERRPQILQKLHAVKHDKQVVILQSRQQVGRFLSTLPSAS
ncbi:MAG: DNA topology modulation protein [Bacteroidota bacterium]